MTVSTKRFRHLMLAGVSDSFCLSFGWTVIMIQLAESDGLGVAGLVSAAMLLGIALSAPVATFAAARMSGRRLLRSAASVEALLRVLMFACLVAQVATAVLVACVIVLNVIAWTGYAAMRAEVAAVSPGSGALTWYATSVAAIEAFAAAAAALMSAALDLDLPLAMVVVVVVYVSGLIPTFIVARGPRRPASGTNRTFEGSNHIRSLVNSTDHLRRSPDADFIVPDDPSGGIGCTTSWSILRRGDRRGFHHRIAAGAATFTLEPAQLY